MLRMLRICGGSVNALKAYVPTNNAFVECSKANVFNLLRTRVPQITVNRNTNFFNKLPADALWKGITSVSNAGKRRGRGKTLMKRKNLNRGQQLGSGKVNILFPGLNAPTVRGSVVLQQTILNQEPKKVDTVDTSVRVIGRKRPRQHPLDRGWSGGKPGGRKVGPPICLSTNEEFEGFQSWIVECKYVSNMTGNLGRKSRAAAFIVTGNGNGLAGFALAKSPEQRRAITMGRNRAGQKLMYIKRHEEHTVLHDFYTQFGVTKLYVKKRAKGYGLHCHRVIKVCCEAIGIKDLSVSLEGSTNPQNILKAFFIGLLQQKTYQEIADETKLHLVEIREATGNYPKVLASPAKAETAENVADIHRMDLAQYIMGGKVILQKKPALPFYTKLKSWDIHRKRVERVRNHDEVRLMLTAKYGRVQSFLTEQYPEAILKFESKKSEA